MFSHEDRCIYRRCPIIEVICQLRFPEILSIEAKVPADFQDAIRAEFPRYTRRQDSPPPKITGAPGNLAVTNQQTVTNHQFASADGTWRVNLTSKFLSLSCNRYTRWEDFAKKLDKPLAAFIRIYKPAFYERVGLRYVNIISRSQLGLSDMPFRELISPCYLGPLGEEDVNETTSTRCSIDCDLGLRGGCRVKIHAGPGMVKHNGQEDKEVKFIFDQDLYMPGQVPINLSAGALQTLHAQAFSIFRGAISSALHDALEPDET